MNVYWLILVGVVRLAFLLAPFLRVEGEFSLQGSILDEAKEFANAAACKAMLISLPVVFVIAVMAEADRACHSGVDLLLVTLYMFAVIALSYGFFQIPAWLYRGTAAPVLWFLVLTFVEVAAQAFLLTKLALLICRS
jgi:hypothetical protein